MEYFYCFDGDLDCYSLELGEEPDSLIQDIFDPSCWNCKYCDFGLNRIYNPRNTLDFWIKDY